MPDGALWVTASVRLPEPYRDVLIKLADGTRRVGRINKAGRWELASYQRCKHQYMASDVVAWMDDASPLLNAAEDLLAALWAIYDRHTPDTMAQARAALARATGGGS